MTIQGRNPPNYQEEVKKREFLDFLKNQGVLCTKEDVVSRQGNSSDSDAVRDLLHCGVKLLISNSRRENRVNARKELESLLVCQAGMYMANKLDDVVSLGAKIDNLLRVEEKKMANKDKDDKGANLEIDMHVHEGSVFPVVGTHSEIMGVQADVIPLHMSPPKGRPAMSVHMPQHMTSARGDSNVLNVGEAGGTLDDVLPKKVAQLERALTYARYRAGKEDIEEVVGYGALCMSMTDGASLASVIIGLHSDIFPLLSKMNKKGGLAYLLSRRSIFDDVQNAMEHYEVLQQNLIDMKKSVHLSIGMSCVVLGVCVALLVRHR